MTKATTPVITSGDPSGIGPDIIIQWLHSASVPEIHILGNDALFRARAKQLGLPFAPPPHVSFESLPLTNDAEHVFLQLKRATQACLDGAFSALITGPVNKAKQNAHSPFLGHTEWLANACDRKEVLMTFIQKDFIVGLVTTHIPLSEVTTHITKERVAYCIDTLLAQFPNEALLVLGLNPHAGEKGLLGNTESMLLAPIIHDYQQNGFSVEGPFPADTAFHFAKAQGKRLLLAMYHDQGITPLKTVDFFNTVNVTLGLPFVRTSVDHGTAYDLVGTGKASFDNLAAAVRVAQQLSSTS